MTEEEKERAGVVELTEFENGRKHYVKRSSVEVVSPMPWNDGIVYLVTAGAFVRHTLENPFLLGEW